MDWSFDLLEFASENTASFLFTTFVLGGFVEIFRRFFNWLWTLNYRGWKVEVLPSDSARKRYDYRMTWEEVKANEASPVEKRRFIQSVVTSEGGWLSAGQLSTDDPEGWVFIDKKKKRYKFDIGKIPPTSKKQN